jgi:hypothetical protein
VSLKIHPLTDVALVKGVAFWSSRWMVAACLIILGGVGGSEKLFDV